MVHGANLRSATSYNIHCGLSFTWHRLGFKVVQGELELLTSYKANNQKYNIKRAIGIRSAQNFRFIKDKYTIIYNVL